MKNYGNVSCRKKAMKMYHKEVHNRKHLYQELFHCTRTIYPEEYDSRDSMMNEYKVTLEKIEMLKEILCM